MPYPIQGRVPNQETIRPAGTDYDDFLELARKLDELLEEMARTCNGYSEAKAALEYSGERRREALSVAFTAIRNEKPQESAASAEHIARSSPGFKDAIQRLFRDEVSCEIAKNHYELLKLRVEVARSKMAVIRAMIGLI